MNPPEKPNLEKHHDPPCLFWVLVESVENEFICPVYRRVVQTKDCGPDCQTYRRWVGNA
jgi:hypothetical protein